MNDIATNSAMKADMKGILVLAGLIAGITAAAQDGNKSPAIQTLYTNNFEAAAPGSVPEEFLILDGQFEVKEEDGNKFLELPGSPLETFSVLFGPAQNIDVAVSARIKGTSRGRRYPTFAVGVAGVGGYRLQVAPGKKAVELYRGDEVKATAPYQWQSGTWTRLRLQIRVIGESAWKIEGKVWPQDAREPDGCQIEFEDRARPPSGRASIWGSPYADTPIQFDDLEVIKLPGGL